MTEQPDPRSAQNSPQDHNANEPKRPKKITFDDFQIQRNVQQQQVNEEREAWATRQRRLEEQKPGILKVVPRLRGFKDEMIGGGRKLSSIFSRNREVEEEQYEPTYEEETPQASQEPAKPYFAEHEKLVVRVTSNSVAGNSVASNRVPDEAQLADDSDDAASDDDVPDGQSRSLEEGEESGGATLDPVLRHHFEDGPVRETPHHLQSLDEYEDEDEDELDLVAGDDFGELEHIDVETDEVSVNGNGHSQEIYDEELYDEEIEEERRYTSSTLSAPPAVGGALLAEEEDEEYQAEAHDSPSHDASAYAPPAYTPPAYASPAYPDEAARSLGQSATAPASPSVIAPVAPSNMRSEPVAAPVEFHEEPQIDPALLVYLDGLRGFDSFPRRPNEARDPRADFVALLNEQLEILREQVSAVSALFFWVNGRKQQLVLESSAHSDLGHTYISEDRKFPIDLDAVSMIVTKRRPELHSLIPEQAELDLIPYYAEAIGIASFAGMPVLFGDSLVAVLAVDSNVEEHYNAETLRILMYHSRLISGLIRSYIEKYDLLSSARTLEAARKLHQIVSPDSSIRNFRDQKRAPEWILRTLTEAASEIIDWEWLTTAAFDESRRIWSITSVQSATGKQYVLPQTAIALDESIVGKCLQSGRSTRIDALTQQQVRFSLEEDRSIAIGHAFLSIPIRTANKNYGVLTIEHSERGRFTEADVETLEHLGRSAAAALEIVALSEIVGERALTDLLTGVLNRRGLLQRLNEELSRAMEYDEPLTLVIFEIDGAAEFFSRFSQEDADTIVLAVTRLLKYGARPFDVVARVGDHAFAALLIKMTDEDAYLWSEKMRKMIVSEVIAIGKRSFSVTVSAGVSGARRDGTVEELIGGAELAVERAKELSGNNVIVY